MEKVCWPGLAPLIVFYDLLGSYLNCSHAWPASETCTLHMQLPCSHVFRIWNMHTSHAITLFLRVPDLKHAHFTCNYLVPMHGPDLKHAHFTCNTPCTLIATAAQELGHEPVPLPLCLGPPLAPAGAAAGAGLPARPPGSCHPWMAWSSHAACHAKCKNNTLNKNCKHEMFELAPTCFLKKQMRKNGKYLSGPIYQGNSGSCLL